MVQENWPHPFGCPVCYGDDAAKVAGRSLECGPVLIDECHFSVSIRRCSACGQRFVHIFTEFIDWTGGNDPQYVDILPVTEAEAAALAAQGEAVDLKSIEALAANRRHLKKNWPNDGPQAVFWSPGGLWIRPGH